MKIFTNLLIIILAALSMSSHASHCFSTDMERNRMKILQCFETQLGNLKKDNLRLQQRITEFPNAPRLSEQPPLTPCLPPDKNALIAVLRCVEAKLDRLKNENRQLQQTIIQLSRVNWTGRRFSQVIAECLSPDLKESQIQVFECFEAKLAELKNENQQLQQMIANLFKAGATVWLSDTVFQDRLPDGSLGPKMVMIPSGRFRMGDIQGGGSSDEQPVHWVSVDGFAMGQYEVTVGQFRRFVNATGYRTDAENSGEGCNVYKNKWDNLKDANWRNPYFSQTDNHPVVCISWNDATAYVKWLSRQTGHQYILPTEAQWEYAARAGTETSRYWGNDPNDACRYANIGDKTAKTAGLSWTDHNCTDGYVYTAPVGQFKPNVFGLFDMIGNTWEWTCSEYTDKYTGKEQQCVESAGLFVVRSGSWYNNAWRARSAFRYWDEPAGRLVDCGVRPARIK